MIKKLTALLAGSSAKSPDLKEAMVNWGEYKAIIDERNEGEKPAPVPEIPYKTQATSGLIDGLRDCENRKAQINEMRASLDNQIRILEAELTDTLAVSSGYAAALLEIDLDAYQSYAQENPSILPIEIEGLELDLGEPVVNPHNQGFLAAYMGAFSSDAAPTKDDLKTFGITRQLIEDQLIEYKKEGLSFPESLGGFYLGDFWRARWDELSPKKPRTRRVT